MEVRSEADIQGVLLLQRCACAVNGCVAGLLPLPLLLLQSSLKALGYGLLCSVLTTGMTGCLAVLTYACPSKGRAEWARRWGLWTVLLTPVAVVWGRGTTAALAIATAGEVSSLPTYGVVLGFLLALRLHLQELDVLRFPLLQRSRLTHLKNALAEAVVPAAETAAAAMPVTWLADSHGVESGVSLFWLGWLTAVIWEVAQSMSMAVQTTRVRFTNVMGFQRKEQLAPLLAALATDQFGAVRHLAALDLCSCGGGRDRTAAEWRTRYIFEDESGRIWKELAHRALEPLLDIIKEIAAQQEATGAERFGAGARDVRKRKLHSSAPLGPMGADVVACRAQLAIWSIQFLSRVCEASRTEDRYGVLQLSSPTIGTVLDTFVSYYLAFMEAFPLSAGYPFVVEALTEECKRGVHRILQAFGEIDKSLLPNKPHYGSIERRDCLIAAFKLGQV